ncbi:MAG: type IX secretion system membrane protein PorP/SprF, partial [bacterium]|nr:type IX secretion system membrane protein PorP/SprF [bacterium]
MKKLLMILLVFYTGMLNAAFEDTGFGTRSLGIGPGFAALADDVSSLYYNPAGLSQLTRHEVLLSFSRLYLGLGSDNPVDQDNTLYSFSAGYSHPLPFIQLGIGYYRFAVSSYYSENVIILSGAKEFKKIHLRTGISLKVLNNSYGSDIYTDVNPVFDDGHNKFGFGTDAGVLYRIKDLSIGLSAVNLFTTDMGLVNEDKPPVRLTLGLAYFIPEKVSFLNSRGFVPCLGVQIEGRDFHLGLGTELWFFRQKQLGLRFNFQWGNNSYSVFALGVSYKKGLGERSDIRFDYGFDYPLSSIKGTYGTHRVGISVG